MLDFLRRFYTSAFGKIVTIFVGVLFIVGFSFLPYIIGEGGGMSPRNVAVVNGKGISVYKFSSYYGSLKNEYRHLYGKRLSQKQFKALNIRGSALSSLIADSVLESKTDVFGIYVSEGFIARNIASYHVFQKNGEFNNAVFTSVLSANHTTPAAFEKKYRLRVARSYIKTVIAESSGMVGRLFPVDYSIHNKSVAFNIAVFKSRKIADGFLKKSILFSNHFNSLVKEFNGTLRYISLHSKVELFKSNYFKKYRFNKGIMAAIYSTPVNEVIGMVIRVRSGFAVIKVSKVYFPRYINMIKNKNKKNKLLRPREAYILRVRREFLYDYVDYLESKAIIKINKKALATFNF